MALRGEPGYPQVLSHPQWGFNKVFFGGAAFGRPREFGSHVMENVLFKVQAPVVIHAQSAIECALRLHSLVRGRLDNIAAIRLQSHQRTLRAIDKKGPLRNPADRDHCLQYAVAVALLHGRLTAEDYEDEIAADPRIDRLRALMAVSENPAYTEAYLDAARRANPNSLEVVFDDGTTTGLVEVIYPMGHPQRRAAGMPVLIEKFRKNLARRFSPARQKEIATLCLDHARLMATPVNELTDAFAAE
jgi:2-methylcitrate dehydratase